MARAVLRLFPGVQLALGAPPTSKTVSIRHGLRRTPIRRKISHDRAEMEKRTSAAEPFERGERRHRTPRPALFARNEPGATRSRTSDDTLKDFQPELHRRRVSHVPGRTYRTRGKVGAVKLSSIPALTGRNDSNRNSFSGSTALSFQPEGIDAYLSQVAGERRNETIACRQTIEAVPHQSAAGSGLICGCRRVRPSRSIGTFIKERTNSSVGYQPV